MIQSNFNLLSSVLSVGWSLIRISCGFRYDNNGTWRFTSLFDAYAYLSFKGTSVWIYGAKKNNHGEYTIQVDGKKYPPIDGFNDGGLFQQVLFSSVELNTTRSCGLWVTNAYKDAARPYLDIDSVSVTIL